MCISYSKTKVEPKGNKAVNLSETDRADLNFEEIKEKVIESLLCRKA